ncbi:conserved hypothetical protein [Caulobacter vibrioides CB15]|uniref:Uncharacterized protein n=1 Tax=Caulobacter vibrioides (strain ATCC 19089 / CIP 103742 / CB 15) TaxID=190650 RepID=Q9AA64_CAUVC|nr:conserved hypothetical protein [Caulobacter vibrioides CB15]
MAIRAAPPKPSPCGFSPVTTQSPRVPSRRIVHCTVAAPSTPARRAVAGNRRASSSGLGALRIFSGGRPAFGAWAPTGAPYSARAARTTAVIPRFRPKALPPVGFVTASSADGAAGVKRTSGRRGARRPAMGTGPRGRIQKKARRNRRASSLGRKRPGRAEAAAPPHRIVFRVRRKIRQAENKRSTSFF